MGFSVFVELPEKFTVISHNVIVENGEKKYVEVWLRANAETRLYKLHFSKELEEQLEESGKGAKKGKMTLFTKIQRGKNQSTDKSLFSTELINKYNIPEKEPI